MKLLASIAVALAGAALAALAAAGPYGRHAGEVTFWLLAPLGLVAVLAAHILVARRARVGGLRRQAAIIGAIVVALLGAAVAVMVDEMFVSGHDALFAALLAAYAAAVGVWSARLLTRAALRDVEAVRATLDAVAGGRRDVRTGVGGNDELAALAADVDAMVAKLDAEERARRSLITAVSHDLRTPITCLRLLAESIDDGVADPASLGDYAARMGTHVRALGALIDDLFELVRLESGELRWTLEQVRLDLLVAETVEAMRPAADANAVAVSADIDPSLVAAQANPERLQRVLFNLLQNAIRHTPRDGSVTVRAEQIDGHVEVEVADTGSGVAAEDRERVFAPFVRVGDGGARSEGGAGLGLAISRAIVEAHGGRIWLAERPLGTAVRFTLPAA
jgi:signal transduction histidine kinase